MKFIVLALFGFVGCNQAQSIEKDERIYNIYTPNLGTIRCKHWRMHHSFEDCISSKGKIDKVINATNVIVEIKVDKE